MAGADNNYVYVVEGDPVAAAAVVRRLRLLALTFAGMLLSAGLAGVLVVLLDESPRPLAPLAEFSFLVLLAALTLYFSAPRAVKKTDVILGGDFLAAPRLTWPHVIATARYRDIVRVGLDVSSDSIVGATIATKGLGLSARAVMDPALVVRTIFERAPDGVKWRRSWQPFRALHRDDVRMLIERAQTPDIDPLLPPSGAWARFEDVFSGRATERRGVSAHLSAHGPARSATVFRLIQTNNRNQGDAT